MAVMEEESSSSPVRSSRLGTGRPPPKGVQYLAKCILRGSVVLQVGQGHIRSPTSNDVVFGKETSIELVAIGNDGIVQSVCEQAVFGTIKDLAVLPWNEKFHSPNLLMDGKDLLVVISDSGKLSFLKFCNEMHRFFAVQHVLLSEPGNVMNQVGRMLAVDSSGCYVAVSAYQERLSLFSVSTSKSNDLIDKRITCPPVTEDMVSNNAIHKGCLNGTIWSMSFISRSSSQSIKEHKPILAILMNRKGSALNELFLIGWNVKDNVIYVISKWVEAGPLAYAIFEVPQSPGIAFLFRIGDTLLMDLRDVHTPCVLRKTSLSSSINVVEEHDGDDEGFIAARALLELQESGINIRKLDDPMCIDTDRSNVQCIPKYVCSCSWEPGNYRNPRMLCCLDTGEFFMMELSIEADAVEVHLSECLYQNLACKTLLWVNGGFLIAIVEMGDGMVLKLIDGKLDYSSPIQNIAPILDMSIMDFHNEKHVQMFACCGMAPEGSLRIIRSGISVERLLRTGPIYPGITGTWAVRMGLMHSNHSFLVLSFVEETRVLSVGVNFTDVTDSVGFQPDVCTLACGLACDGLLVQIHHNAVRLCMPTDSAHPEGIPCSSPVCTSWSPNNVGISLGSVGHSFIAVATSNPCILIILGIKLQSMRHYEVYEMLRVVLQHELSCISIPSKQPSWKESTFLPTGVDISNTFVIGTHKPSVEVLSFSPGKGIRALAVGAISITNTMGNVITGCIPQDVRLVCVDRLYLVSGLRNGMLLRFEWPTAATPYLSASSNHRAASGSFSVCKDTASTSASASSNTCFQGAVGSYEKTKENDLVSLPLIAIRRIGIAPVFLVPLSDLLDSDIIALSDRPWLVQTARHSLSYVSISFEPSSHVTPVCSAECPKGLLFVAENSLNLVEMVHSKRLNVQKFHLGGTPRKVLYHSDSRLLLVLRTELSGDSLSSDVCCVDPLSGSVLSSFNFEPGETGKCMTLVKVGSEEVLVVGTSSCPGPAIMPNGEAESTKGRLLVLCLDRLQSSDNGSMVICAKVGSSSQRASSFSDAVGYPEQMSNISPCSSPDDGSCDGLKLEDGEAWQLRLTYSTLCQGVVLAVCTYLDTYFVASAGNAFYVCTFPNNNPQRVKRMAQGRTRFMIVSLASYFTEIAVGDCRDGILFYSYHEDYKRVEQLYCDPGQRLVADCLLTDTDTAVVSDRKGSIAVLTKSRRVEAGHLINVSPEYNLTVAGSYYLGEIAMTLSKGSFLHKLPAENTWRGRNGGDDMIDLSHNSVMAGTLLGSIVIFIPISSEEYELLKVVQARLAVHPLTSPILGNNHTEFRSRENMAGARQILDGDLLAQFLELTSIQQEAVLDLPCASAEVSSSFKSTHPLISVDQVVQLLERVHYALN